MTHRLATALAAGSLAAAGLAATVAAQPAITPMTVPDQIAAGRRLTGEHCAICHATGLEGASPRAAAPPFRKLGDRYTEEALTEALSRGMLERHPDMPPFRFSPDEIAAICAYLRSIQEVRGV